MYHEVDLCWLCLIGYPVLSSEPWFWTALLRFADFFDGPQVGAKSVIRTNHWLFQLDLSRFCAILGKSMGMFCGFGFYLKISLSAHILLVKSKSGSTFFGGYHPSNQSTDPENTAFLEEICLPTQTTSQFLCYHHYRWLRDSAKRRLQATPLTRLRNARKLCLREFGPSETTFEIYIYV